ncbi:MAG TPA: CoA transferase [Gammaproteobacteria bacterium]|nr:CoA transferase [Gammaproteobacteria bacterium]
MDQPLRGLSVLDLGQVYQGPYAGFLLARAGADVIKIEPPGGEPLRAREKIGGGAILPMAMLNTNKRGITLNLKSEKGRAMLCGMVRGADVLIENYAPGVMERLGVGAERLMEENPRLVYASGTGFGLSGPDRDTLAMDLTVQAVSGMMSVTGFPDGPPLKAGPAVADFLSGTHLYGAIMTALFERERTGRGRLVEVAMEEAVYPTLASNLGIWHSSGGKVPPRTGNRHGGLAIAPYNVYPASDGHVAVICVTDQHWRNLARAMEQEELADDPRFASNAERVRNLDQTDRAVGDWCARRTRAQVLEAVRRHRVPAAPVRDLDEVARDPHMHQRGMLQWLDHPELGPVVVPNSPLRLHGTEAPGARAHPDLGQHNVEVYAELLGLSAQEVDALAAEGVI